MKRQGILSCSAILTFCALAVGTGSALANEHKSDDVKTVEVVATEFAFEPSRIEVAPGSRVKIKLVNAGSLSHNLHIAGKDMKTETIQTDSTDTVTLTAPKDGSLTFFCNVPGHKQAGMTGSLVTR